MTLQDPVVQDRAGAAENPGSLLDLQIQRRKSANKGWAADGRGTAIHLPDQPASCAAGPELANDSPQPATDAAVSRPHGDVDVSAGQPGDIFAYWRDRRDGRPFPAWSDFNPDQILAQWPNSVLLACGADLEQPRLAASFTEALRAAKRKDAETLTPSVEYTPLLTEWLLSLGREVARLGKPLNDSESLPALKGRVSYRVVGLPLGESPMAVDHVLCHVMRN